MTEKLLQCAVLIRPPLLITVDEVLLAADACCLTKIEF